VLKVENPKINILSNEIYNISRAGYAVGLCTQSVGHSSSSDDHLRVGQ